MTDVVKIYLKKDISSINTFLKTNTNSFSPLVKEITQHILLSGGKRVRPLLTLLCARIQGKTKDSIPLACSLEMIHAASLLHDDILDDSNMRRKNPTAHTIFGNNATILAGDALLARASRIAAEYNNAYIVKLFASAVEDTASGAIDEMYHTGDAELTEKEYYEIIIGKTAKLFEFSCRMGACCENAPIEIEDALGNFGLNIGIAFQLVDDSLDYASSSEDTGKPIGGDLREGKMTLPLILYLQTREKSERKAIKKAFTEKNLSAQMQEEIIYNITHADFTQTTRNTAKQYIEKATQNLNSIADCKEKEILLQIAQYVIARIN